MDALDVMNSNDLETLLAFAKMASDTVSVCLPGVFDESKAKQYLQRAFDLSPEGLAEEDYDCDSLFGDFMASYCTGPIEFKIEDISIAWYLRWIAGSEDEGFAPLAFRCLRDKWYKGHRDRTLALWTMFWGWYCQTDQRLTPKCQWGPEKVDCDVQEARKLFQEAYDALGVPTSTDPEVLLAFGVIASRAPELLPGDPGQWRKQARISLARLLGVRPQGFPKGYIDLRTIYGRLMDEYTGRPVIEIIREFFPSGR
ncbi:MAG: hypothetical protein KGR26_03460 [Cyanobacteria bacterium REEB65]|nr:hypothetical protein [Cyanobacteria bacterium REEB65]